MKIIGKFTIPVLEKFSLELPKNSYIIRIADVDGKFFLWAIIDTEAEKETRFFECYKTGQPIETEINNMRYIGHFKMFIMQELCLYVFEVTLGKTEHE